MKSKGLSGDLHQLRDQDILDWETGVDQALEEAASSKEGRMETMLRAVGVKRTNGCTGRVTRVMGSQMLRMLERKRTLEELRLKLATIHPSNSLEAHVKKRGPIEEDYLAPEETVTEPPTQYANPSPETMLDAAVEYEQTLGTIVGKEKPKREPIRPLDSGTIHINEGATKTFGDTYRGRPIQLLNDYVLRNKYKLANLLEADEKTLSISHWLAERHLRQSYITSQNQNEIECLRVFFHFSGRILAKKSLL